jgi:hypothetical protein
MTRASCVLYFWLFSAAVAAELVPEGPAVFAGQLLGDRDLSAVQFVGEFLVIASDETAVLQFLRPVGEARYEVSHELQLLADQSVEIDLEALALDGETLYALGSHSRFRRRPDQGRSRDDGDRGFEQVNYHESRDKLFRVDLDLATGRPKTPPAVRSLRPLLDNQPVLKPFAATPGKENGADFEGMAVVGERLYLGFRGPVLRGNYVPVLTLRFDDVDECAQNPATSDDKCRLLFLNLGGRGVRSLHPVDDGFLLIAGPMGDGDFSYQLYFWDGRNCMPYHQKVNCTLTDLGVIPGTHNAGAEGLAVLGESASVWRILIVYDGIEGGKPARFRVARPGH